MQMDAKMTAAEAANFLDISPQAVHKKIKTQELEFQKNQNRVFFGYKTAKELFKIPFKNSVIAFQIVKGGTGKTSLAHSVAIRANLYGARVLCIDLDQQGNLTQALGVNAEEFPVMIDVLKGDIDIEKTIVSVSPGLDIIPSRIENAVLDNAIILGRLSIENVYKERIKKLRKKYDLIVIDCPPALGQSVAAIALSVDLIIAPVTPEEFSLSGLKITYQEVKALEKNYGVKINFRLVLNKHDARTTLSHEVLMKLTKHHVYGDMMFHNYIRASQEIPNSVASGYSVFSSLKPSTAKEDIDLLTREILGISVVSKSHQTVNLGNLEENQINSGAN